MTHNGKNILLTTLWRSRLVLVILIFTMACSRAVLVEGVKEDTVVAIVNDADITVKELRSEVRLLMKQFRVKDLSDITLEEKLLLKTRGLNKIIKKIILRQEINKNRISLTRNEYKDSLNKIKAEYGGNSFNEYLAVEGISLKEWENSHKLNILIKKMINEIINSTVNVTDKQIEKFYDKNLLAYQRKEQVRAFHIMVETESEIRDIINKLRSKKHDFSILAKEFSLGPEATLGGDLGYFEKGQMPEEFDGVFELELGKVSNRIKTPYGNHIFKVIDKRPARQMTLKESRKSILNQLVNEEQSKAFKNWMIKIKNKSDIKIKHDVLGKIN